jgi:outer membrane protein OmpA-like peptidoglycan-associated protein
MKKTIVFIAIIPLLAFAQEISFFGNRGMFRVKYAEGHKMGKLSFHLNAVERYQNNRVLIQGDSTTDRNHFLQTRLGISYAINDFVETRFHVGPFTKYYEANDYPIQRGDPSPVIGINTYELGLKLGYLTVANETTPTTYAFGIDGYVDFGPSLSTELFSNAFENDRALYADSFYPPDYIKTNTVPHIPHNPDFGFDALFDFLTGPFALHLNVGYLITGTDQNPGYVTAADFALLERDNIIPHGLGIELGPAKDLRFLFETSGYSTPGIDSTVLWVTPGIRFGTTNVSFDLGVQLAVVGEWFWKPFFNFSGGYDLVEKPTVPIAHVTGTVTDARMNTPIAGTITFPDTEKEAVPTSPDGSYKLSLPPGSYRIRADAPEHRWREQNIVLKDGDRITLNFPLNTKPMAKVTGRIYDAETNAPVIANITFPQTEFPTASSDSTGFYSVDLAPGTFRLRVLAPDYLAEERFIDLKDNETQVTDIPLHKGGVLTGKVSEFETGKALLAQVIFVGTEIPRATTEGATGIYKAGVPPGTYTVRVEAADYIPETIPLVMERDETKIQNFVLKPVPKVGERVVLKGITFDFNSAVVKPISYPALDDAARVLKAKPKMKVEIGGHTDSVGPDAYNMKLSNERAMAVREYLMRYHNIETYRLIAVGYGETQPIADNRTRSGRDMNRRIEFKILSW